MRHRNQGRKLSLTKGKREALVKNLAIALILNKHIITTKPRAKEAQRFVERQITIAKTGKPEDLRKVIGNLSNATIAQKLFKEIAPSYKERKGGYTRITNTAIMRGDNAQVVKLELL